MITVLLAVNFGVVVVAAVVVFLVVVYFWLFLSFTVRLRFELKCIVQKNTVRVESFRTAVRSSLQCGRRSCCNK